MPAPYTPCWRHPQNIESEERGQTPPPPSDKDDRNPLLSKPLITFMIICGLVKSGLHMPDLALECVAPEWRPFVNALYHLSTVGSVVGGGVFVCVKWEMVKRGFVESWRGIGNYFSRERAIV